MAPTKKKILIVEDEKPIARALELKLAHAGFDVTQTNNGEDGLALINQNTYALILLDLMMPKMDGFKVLTILKERKVKVPVFVLTNLSQPEDEKHVRELGAVGFFVKSNTPLSQIVARVQAEFK